MPAYNHDDRLVDPEDVRPPNFASVLLVDLGVERESKDVQRSAIADWLATHHPSPSLTTSLVRAGLMEAPASARAMDHPLRIFITSVHDAAPWRADFRDALVARGADVIEGDESRSGHYSSILSSGISSSDAVALLVWPLFRDPERGSDLDMEVSFELASALDEATRQGKPAYVLVVEPKGRLEGTLALPPEVSEAQRRGLVTTFSRALDRSSAGTAFAELASALVAAVAARSAS
jgi:hypothetical protein